MHTRDRVQGLRRRSNRAHETPMRSRRFVALFGGRTADGPGELRSEGNENEEAGEYGSSDRGSAADVGRRDAGGTARHASARATWRETIRANNRQEAPPSWRERGTTVVLNLAPLAGTTKQTAAKWSSPMAPRKTFRPFGCTIQTGVRNYS